MARPNKMPGFFLLLAAGACLAADFPGAARVPEPPISDAERGHWAFRKPVQPPLPTVGNPSWVRTPVDAFILARLEKEGLAPAPAADRAALLRRVTFDLTGLPPTIEEQEAFLADSRPDAFARVVERLLSSPHYGERWAQHWLDVVRYAETNGYELDAERPHAWRYRDYVIDAFRADKPYDQFIREQVAGDELAAGQDPRARSQYLIATGFHRCGPVHMVSGNVDPDENRQEILTEMTVGVGAAFLGLTIGCARCHDHKFDPVSQADYYRMQAFFAAAQYREIDIYAKEEQEAYERRVKELRAQMEPFKKQVGEIEKPYQARLREAKLQALEPMYREALQADPKKRTPEQKKLAEHANILIKVTWDELLNALPPAERERRAGLRAVIHALEARMPPPPAQAWCIRNGDSTPATHLLKRGDPKKRGPILFPGVPRVLQPPDQAPEPARLPLPCGSLIGGVVSAAAVGGNGLFLLAGGHAPLLVPAGAFAPRLDRIALARWLTGPDQPLTARVMVNRVWQHHFGRGLVATPNDFGLRGQPPSHPELLDWLAVEFVRHGWSVKHLHRLMVLSATYQQSSQPGPAALKVDPENRLWSRMQRRRLEGESLRDSVLAVAGTLNPKLGGPMIRVPIEPEVYDLIFTEGEPDGLWHVTPDPSEHRRRSIYLFLKRNVRMPLFEAFDQPDTLTPCAARSVSIFAPQALILLNGPFMQEQSKAFAARLERACDGDIDRMIDRAHRLALGRPPRPEERALSRAFLARQEELIRKAGGAPSAFAAALADFCLAMLNRNEFLYVN